LSIVSAYFTTFAYDRLRATLGNAGQVRFLFGEPRFLKDADNAGLVPPAFAFDESGLRLTEQIRQRGARNKTSGGRQSRYERLMDDVIRAGLPTKVLLLSATPVNNDLSDLKAQLDLISGERGDGFAELGVPNLGVLIGNSRRRFADWAKSGSRNAGELLNKLPPALFGLLDGVTITRCAPLSITKLFLSTR